MENHENAIAIVGVSCLFPGAGTPEQFWHNLTNGLNTTSEATAAEFGADPATYYDPQRRTHDTTYSLRGGYVREAVPTPPGMDKAAAWSLYVAQQALDDAGYANRADVLERCGLILGNLLFPTQASARQIAPIYDAALGGAMGDLLGLPDFRLTRADAAQGQSSAHEVLNAPATAVAHALGLGAAHFCIDAACASSLYAFALACEYLRAGKADLMLAGAASAADPLFVTMGFTHFGAYPQNGQSRPLDAHSDGLLSGEGAGLLALKRYADARRDGDKIYAIIGGIGLSNDGRGKHPLTPNAQGQVNALQRAYSSGIRPEWVQYVECHASGTPLGDKTELHSMDTFFGAYNAAPLIGSVKANHGHLLTVAAAASTLKCLLAMQHDQLPATIGIEMPLESQRFGSTQIVRQNTAWPGAEKIAGVNAFGFGGVSAHLVLVSEAAFRTMHPQGAQATQPQTQPPAPTRLAIVGMDAHFGDCDGLEQFATTLYDGEQHFVPLPPKRWKGLADDAPRGAYIGQFEIDFLRFKFPPREDDQPTPQHLLLLKVADGAVRDARLTEGSNVAVIVALGTELSLHQYRSRLDLSWQVRESLARAGFALDEAETLERVAKDAISPPAQVNGYMSYIGNIVSTRVSALWNFSGPSLTLSASESSVFRALEVAQLLLNDDSIDGVVIGAVDLAAGVENIALRRQQHPVNTGAVMLSFDQNANGWQPGEGAGAVVVRRADRANGARVYATIEAVATFSGTDAGANTQAIGQALAAAGIHAADVGYVEASAGGIAAQDDAEIASLTRAYTIPPGEQRTHPTTALGSVKANIGHTGAAAGIASLIKTALALHGRFIPMTPNWTAPKHPEQWANTPFYVAQESRAWFGVADRPRYAAVNSIGGDGTSAHVILASAPPVPGDVRPQSYLASRSLTLLPIAADDLAGLLAALDGLEAALSGDMPLNRIAADVFARFAALPDARYSLSLVARDRDGLRKEIDLARKGVPAAFERGGEWLTPAGSAFQAHPLGERGKIAFVYPGGFNSYPYVGQDWLQMFPNSYDYLASLNRNVGDQLADELVYPRYLATPTRQQVRAARVALADDQRGMIQSGTAIAILFTHVARTVFKLQPSAAFGYSMGEGSMLWAMGVWQDSDTASGVFTGSNLFRTRLFGRKEAIREEWGLPDSTPDDFWASFVVAAPAHTVQEAVEAEHRVYVTHINTPNEVVIAGDPAACERVIARMGGNAIRAPFDVVIHNEAIMSEWNEFYRLHHWQTRALAEDITFYSSADFEPTPLQSELLARCIARVSCKAVDFPRLIRRAYADGVRIFIELGPGSTCTRWIGDTLRADGVEHVAVSADNLRLDSHTALVKMLARLVSHRVPMDLSALYPSTAADAVPEKRLMRTSTLGGERVQDVIGSAENRAWFSQSRPHRRTTELPGVMPIPASPVQVAASVGASVGMPVMSPVLAPTSTPPAASLTPIRLQEREMSPAGVGEPVRDLAGHASAMQTRLTGLQALGDAFSATADVFNTLYTTYGTSPHVLPVEQRVQPVPGIQHRYTPRPAVFTTEQIDQFARGSIAACFGPEYSIYENRRAPRIPNTDLMLVSRIVDVGATRLETKTGSFMVAEYDVPPEMWFYAENPSGFTPYSMLMEMALQPCGFLSAYMGPTFQFPDTDFYFRNLDGQGTLTRDVDLRGRTLVNRVVLTSSTVLQGIIIQKYTFDMMLNGEAFYTGSSTFGYFTRQALDSQAGLDGAGKAPAKWHEANPGVPLTPVPGNRAGQVADASGLALPTGKLAFLDDVQVSVDGGAHGQGYATATSTISPQSWFLACHFYQDPVMPGSLGLETITQAMEAYAMQAGLGREFANPRFGNAEGGVTWKYRGQVLGESGGVQVEVQIKRVERTPGETRVYADANLWRGGARIYEFKDVGLSIREEG